MKRVGALIDRLLHGATRQIERLLALVASFSAILARTRAGRRRRPTVNICARRRVGARRLVRQLVAAA